MAVPLTVGLGVAAVVVFGVGEGRALSVASISSSKRGKVVEAVGAGVGSEVAASLLGKSVQPDKMTEEEIIIMPAAAVLEI